MPGLKVHDVAARLNVSEKTVYKWLQQGLIPATRIGKTWIITEESVDAMLRPAGRPGSVADSESRGGYSAGQSRSLPSSASRHERAGTLRPFDPSMNSGHRRLRTQQAQDGQRRHSPESDKETLQKALSQFNRTLSGAVEHGIEGILAPRRQDPATPRAIASALEAAEGEVLLQGIGLREFFGNADHTVILRQMAAEDRPVRVRALLVNPAGQFARARSIAEDGAQFADDSRFRAGPLFGDSWRSLNVIASLRRAGEGLRRFSLDVRFIDHWPSVYLVMTRACAFVETYHFGRPEPEMEGSTIEGLVPMFQISADSTYYTLLRSHFDYLWSGQNPFAPSLTLEQVAQEMHVQL